MLKSPAQRDVFSVFLGGTGRLDVGILEDVQPFLLGFKMYGYVLVRKGSLL